MKAINCNTCRRTAVAEYEDTEEDEKEKKLMREMVYQATRLNPPELLSSGEFKGYNYYVLSQGTHPCGYVEIPSESGFFNVDYDDIPVDCHGGLTYGRGYLTGVAEEAENRYFIGWDYAHFGDYMGYYSTWELSGAIHYTDEIVRECKNVIAQLIELEDVSDNNVGKKEE